MIEDYRSPSRLGNIDQKVGNASVIEIVIGISGLIHKMMMTTDILDY